VNWLRPLTHNGVPGCELRLYVQPGATRSGPVGEHDGLLKFCLRAAPVGGAANAALIAALAERLDLPKREVILLRGSTTRRKTVWLAAPPAQTLAALHGDAPG